MKTEIIVILDRSGSMESIAKEVINGFNSFVKEQQEQPGKARLTLVQFDDKYELNYEGVKLSKVPALEFVPRNMTALYDAIGRTLNEQGKRIVDEKWADLVIVNIITDGAENASKEFDQPIIKEMVSKAEKDGWKFLFMAANQDAFAAARSYGISGGLVGNFAATAKGTQMAYETTSATMSSLRSGAQINSLVSTS